jgi:uncharacterized membrane protein
MRCPLCLYILSKTGASCRNDRNAVFGIIIIIVVVVLLLIVVLLIIIVVVWRAGPSRRTHQDKKDDC